jgi:AcrR family transcriptional regulator
MSPRSKKLSALMRHRSRDAILAASLELFAKRGYSGTTTEAIARKAGVSKGLIFTHFATKQEILFAIMDEQFDRVLPRFFLKNDSRPAKEKLTSLVNSWLELIKSDTLLVRLSLQLNLDDEYRKAITNARGKEYLGRFLSQMKGLFKELGSPEPELNCYLLMFLFDGIVANYTVAPELFPIDEIKDHLMNLLLSRTEKATDD